MEDILIPQGNEQLTPWKPYFQGMLHPMVAYLGLGKLHRNKFWHNYKLHNWVNPGLLGAPQLSVSGLEADELGRHKPNDRTLRSEFSCCWVLLPHHKVKVSSVLAVQFRVFS
jgi:hypothetical protein